MSQSKSASKPWRNEQKMRELHQQELTGEEIGDKLGCHYTTVNRWLLKHGITENDSGSSTPATYRMATNGYMNWWDGTGSKTERAAVHKLLACVEHDPSEVKNKHVHHKNGIKWDNRSENIELITPGDHMEEHDLHEPKYSKEDCIIAMKQFVIEYGEEPTKKSWSKSNILPSEKVFRRIFGSWSEAKDSILPG